MGAQGARMNSVKGTRYGFPSFGHIDMNHDNQKIILCEEGQAK